MTPDVIRIYQDFEDAVWNVHSLVKEGDLMVTVQHKQAFTCKQATFMAHNEMGGVRGETRVQYYDLSFNLTGEAVVR